MRLQRILGRRYGDKTYYKWQIVIPSDLIEKAGFTEGEELDITARDGSLTIKRPRSH